MKISRNEKCYCGSNKKIKNCCREIFNSKLNNNLQRRYMCEFSLHTYSSNVSICYPNDLSELKNNGSKYHIYMINRIPRLSLVKESLKLYEDHVELQIKKGVLENIEYFKVEFAIDKVNHIEEFSIELENDKYLIIKNKNNNILKLGVIAIYNEFILNLLSLEILYIGQSYGKDGNRDALERLKAHSTLQEILQDTINESIENEIVITLWEFTPRLHMDIDGRTKKYMKTDNEDLEHLNKVTSTPPLIIDKQIINITEAALINYFKPKYNEVFKNNFPDISHKGYKFYYDYDYNSIIVELDTECINIDIYSESSRYSLYRPIKYDLNSDEDRKSIFDF